MNVILPRGDASNLLPGHWAKDADGLILVRCPHADHVDKRPRIGVIHRGVSDSKYWNIDAEGKVTPSIFFNEPNCGWHVFATLADWAKNEGGE